MEQYLTAGEVKEMLRISETGLRGMIKRGDIPKPTFGGGTRGASRRWKRSDIEGMKKTE